MRGTGFCCPLCVSENIEEFHQDRRRDYLRCLICDLVFVPPSQFLSREDEKKRYDLHQNSPDDPAYRQFLNRIFNPIKEYLAPGSRGLDFGSGPGPTLSVMFEESGHSAALYDYFYAPDEAVLKKRYDFITASEVVEHLRHPRKDLDRLWKCLKPGGLLGIMTKLVLGREAFAKWHYKEEPSHICFFSRETFEWLAIQWGSKVSFVGKDVMLFRKK